MAYGARSALPRPAKRQLCVAALAMLATLVVAPSAWAAQDPNPLNLSRNDFIGAYFVIAAVAAVMMSLIARIIRATGPAANVEGLSPVAIGYLVDRMPRAFDALFLTLASYGAAEPSGSIFLRLKPGDRALPSDLEAFRRELPDADLRDKMIARMEDSSAAAEMRADLRRRGLILSVSRYRLLITLISLITILVVGFGVVKFVIEFFRNQPIEALALICGAAGVGVILWAKRVTTDATWATGIAIEQLRKRLDSVIKAPRDEQVALAVALAGASALAGTRYADYADAMNPPSSSSGDDDDDD